MSQKSFLCSSFNPFYSLKCVLGAGENELEPVQCLAFLSVAITEDPQRRSEKLKQAERSVLAVLCKIIVSPLDPFYFYCFPFLLLVFPSPRPCLPLLSSLIFYPPLVCLSPCLSFHLLSHLLPSSLILLSSHLHSSASIFCSSDELVKWYSVQKMENTFSFSG